MEVLAYPKFEKQLRTPGRLVTPEDLRDPFFIQKLNELVKLSLQDGIGIAATQVGWGVKVFVLVVNSDMGACQPTVYLNPTILGSHKPEKELEGCLSFKDLFLKIERPSQGEWGYLDLSWVQHIQVARGYYAKAVQHEIDHLEGRLFIDLASPVQHKTKVQAWLKKVAH